MKQSLPAKHVKNFKVAYQPVKNKKKKKLLKTKIALFHFVRYFAFVDQFFRGCFLMVNFYRDMLKMKMGK